MSKLKVLASGSQHAQAQARGKLFEKLMAEVLRSHGYEIDVIPSVNYAGMEIDIEGRHISGAKLYAECKCYETDIESPKLQAFFGKYMSRWLKDERVHGLFIALPALNSHAKAFYRENCENNGNITMALLEEEQVLERIFHNQRVVRPEVVAQMIPTNAGIPGEWLLLYTEKGMFYVQYIIPTGGALPRNIAFFDSRGRYLSEKDSQDYLLQLYPELGDFALLSLSDGGHLLIHALTDHEEIVEVQGSSACFEYQFPASPEYFVGRQKVLAEVDSFVAEILAKETSSRGLLFEANSGWGKSSLVLSTVQRMKEAGHFALAIDSRSASSSQFVLRVADYVLAYIESSQKLVNNQIPTTPLTGFEGAIEALLALGTQLEQDRRLLFIFLDQFENLFFLHDALRKIRDLFLKLCDAQVNIVLGFSWKTDLIGLTSEFPYQLRDAITGSSKRILLDPFSENETSELLGRLREELRAPLRPDLRFFLSQFSQGYPWLLKKLCAHVKAQRAKGVLQAEIANSLLNVEELFQEDLRGLTAKEEEALKRIAKLAPVGVVELGEEFRPEVVQSLVHARLIVRVGSKYDIYWDIFRDYLNTGQVPVQENYLLRIQVRAVITATRLLTESGGRMSVEEFQERADLTEKSFYNVLKDMRLLGLATLDNSIVTLQIPLLQDQNTFTVALRAHIRDKLPRNRLISRLVERWETEDALTLDQFAHLLEDSCPYISATQESWRTYARVFVGWMDFADLAVFDSKEGTLTRFKPGIRVPGLQSSLIPRRGQTALPIIQYPRVELAAIRIVEAVEASRPVDWTGFEKTTIVKVLHTLRVLDFITLQGRESIEVSPRLREVLNPAKRLSLFAEGILLIQPFVAFIGLLRTHKDSGCTLLQLGIELRTLMQADWNDNTAKQHAKILLGWARQLGLAPGAFAVHWARRNKRTVDAVQGKLLP